MPNEQIVRTTLQIDADIANFEKGLQQIQQSLNQLQLPKGFADSINQRMGSIRGTLSKLKELTEGGLIDKKDISTVNNLVNTITKSFSALQTKLSSEGIAEAGLKKDQAALLALTKLQKDYQRSVAATDKEEERLTNELEKQKKKREEIQRAQQQRIKDNDKYAEKQVALESARRAKNEAIRAQRDAKEAARARIEASGGKYSGVTDPNFKKTNEGQQLKKAIVDATKAVQAYEQAVLEAEKYTSDLAEKQAFEKVDKEINNATQALKEYQDTGKNIDQAAALDETLSKFKEIKDIDFSNYGIDESAINSFEELEQSIDQVNIKAQQNRQVVGTEMAAGLGIAETANENLAQATENSTQAIDEQNERAKNVTGVLNRIKQFVGLAGATMTFRRVAQDAISTIKELDKQMTEMAVVTNLDVGDYWEQLPEYTKRANELGVSIKSAYEAATLYYQQGLKNNEVVQVSNSTLKMARIAGLNAAEATDRMTAALRGFNMEVTQTNADRVADVYSKLAAITASNVNEISVAMTKTASIASNANMQFETTAAFLSQIIETTRESAETAGTALKTVIARFQELKKDPAEIGEVDGEIVDANKIETALRSVDVALRDTNGQFRDLDQVFLELASKWDGLDTNTQRYIATIAAGSRQQSRFIAMMSNYSRTTELVTAANNAAGTSNQQFEKTLDSLESKLAKLSNAWHEFTMGLVNNELIKGGIDLLTDIFNILNKITQGWDSWSGGALKIGLVTAALYAGDKALNIFLKHFTKGETVFASFGAVGKAAIDKIKNGFQSLVLLHKTKITLNYDTKAASKAIESFKQSSIRLQQVQSHIQKQQQSNLVTEKALTKAKQMEKTYQEQQTIATLAYGKAMGLNNDQASAAIALTLSKVPADTAAAAALGGLTLARQTDLEAQMIAMGLSPEERAQRMQEIAQTYALVGAKEMEGATTQKGVLVKLREVAVRFLSKLGIYGEKTATDANTASKVAETAAVEGQTVANEGLLATLGPIALALVIIIAAVGVLVLLVWGIVEAVKAAKKNSPEGQLESSKEALEQVTEAANSAAEAYNNLNDSLETLHDKYDALEELTRGTQDWKTAVAEINDQVVDLIDKYPELASAITNVGGVLTIAEDKQDAVMDQYLQRKQILANAVMYSKQDVLANQQEVDYKNLSGKARLGFSQTAGTKFEQQTKQLAQALSSGSGNLVLQGNTKEKRAEEINKYLKEELGLDSEYSAKQLNEMSKEIEESTTELINFGKELRVANEQTKAYNDSMASNALLANSTYNSMAEDAQQAMSTIFSGDYYDKYIKAEEEKWKDVDKNNLDDIQQEVQGIYGYDAKIDKNGEVTYYEGGEKKTESAEAAKRALLASRANKQFTDNLDKAQSIYSAQSKTSVKKALQTGNVQGLTKAEIKELVVSQVEGVAEDNELNNQIKATFESIQKNAELELRQAGKAINDRLTKSLEFSDKLTVNEISGLSKHYETVLAANGEEAVQILNQQLSALLEDMTDNNKEIFVAQLNAIDWTNAVNFDGLAHTLTELEVPITNSLTDFINSVRTSANALYNISWSDLQARVTKLGSVIDKIASGEQKRNFDDDEYQEIIKVLPDKITEFVQNLDGSYTYLGNSMEDLSSALQQNTQTILQQKAEGLNAARYIKTIQSEDQEKRLELQGNDYLGYFKTLYNSFIGKDFSIASLGIENLGNNFAALISLTNEELEQAYKEVQAKAASYSISGWQDYINTAGLTYQSNNEITNAQQIKAYAKSFKLDQGNDWLKAELQAYFNAAIAQATESGMSETYIQQLKQAQQNALKGEEFDEELLYKYVAEPWKETFGIIAEFDTKIKKFNDDLEVLTDKYEELTEAQNVNIAQLTDNLNEQIETLKNIRNYAAGAINGAQQEVDEYIQDRAYLSTSTNQKTGRMELTYDASKLGNTDASVAAEAYKKATELVEKYNEYVATSQSATKQLSSLQKTAKKDINDLTQKVKEALIEERQSEIDKLSEINETLESVKSDLISGIKETLEEDRRERQNQKELDEITDKETRLSYLMAESGSGNQLEILQLQKEIEEASQSYQDSLINQQLDAMEKANDAAAQQRERQITIAQNQLDYWSQKHAWDDAKQMVDAAIQNPTGQVIQRITGLLTKEQYGETLKEQLNSINTAIGQGITLQSLEKAIKEGPITQEGSWSKSFKSNFEDAVTQGIIKSQEENKEKGEEINETYRNADGTANIDEAIKDYKDTNSSEQTKSIAKATIQSWASSQLKQAKNKNELSNTWNTVSGKYREIFGEDSNEYQSLKGQYDEYNRNFDRQTREDLLSNIQNASSIDYLHNLASSYKDTMDNDTELQLAYFRKTRDLATTKAQTNSELRRSAAPIIEAPWGNDSVMTDSSGWYKVGDPNEQAVVANSLPGQLFLVGSKQVAVRGNNDDIHLVTGVKDNTIKKLRDTIYDFSAERTNKGWRRFKTGGLANFTGPAWLDGTPSAPELVLNQTDTKNFIALRDILAEIMKSNGVTNNNETTNNGDTYVDVDINVDSIDGDYDVEQLAQQVQEIIVRDSTYRNPNSITTVR